MEKLIYILIMSSWKGFDMIGKLFFIIFFIPVFSFGSTNLAGYWAVKCGGFGGNLQINPEGEVEINVNDNNLFVSARLVDDAGNHSTLYYQEVIESENNVINWGDISKSKPIAIVLLNGSELNLSWNGFYDQKKRNYIWSGEPDFVVAAGGKKNIKMKRCDFN